MIWLVVDVEGVRVPVRSRRPTAAQWLAGTRPRTLPAAIAPVLAGTGVAATTNQVVWWKAKLLVVGALAVAAAWTYTGGPWPYGYHALGEVSVFLFFGLVAVLGTAYVQTRAVTGTGLAVAAAMGGFAGAILVANNLRDVASDGRAGKRTLAVVLGVRRTQVVFGGLLALPFVTCLSVAGTHPGALVALGSLPLIVASVRRLAGGATGLALVAVLRETARAELGYAILLAVGLALR